MNTLHQSFMADRKTVYLALIELCQFCKTHNYQLLLTNDTESTKTFRIKLTSKTKLVINIDITENEHLRPFPIIDFKLDIYRSHTKVVKAISKPIKIVGGTIGAGVGFVFSALQLCGGLFTMGAFTYGGAKVGQMPGKFVDKLDGWLMDGALERHSGEIQAITTLLTSRMVELPSIDVNSPEIASFLDSYAKEHSLYTGSFNHSKRKLSFMFNNAITSEDKKLVKFYKTFSSDESDFIIELKAKTVEHAEIILQKDALEELFSEYYSHYVETNRTQLFASVNLPVIEESEDQLLETLKKQLL